jgi:hypothetical protein
MQLSRQTPAAHHQPESPAFDIARPTSELATEVALRQISVGAGRSFLKIVQEFAGLTFGPGKISFQEYVKLRLFDDDFYAGVDKKTVIGLRRNREIWAAVNYRTDWLGLLANKVASASYLASYGFPITPFVAIYGENLETDGHALMCNRDELRAFITNEAHYPIFGKPTEGYQSLGSVALRRYVASTSCLERCDGMAIPVENFLDEIATNYATGYLFQKFVSPHPAIRALCGDRLATVRIVTLVTEHGPRVFRACWKIPAGSNSADNYWRAGNLLAQIDTADGKVLRVISGTGLELTEVTHHPDTGAALIGTQIPHWESILGIALSGAKLMQHVSMIGWDIAAAESGAVLVEMNETPDLFLHQLSDRRGVLEQELLDFVAYQERNARDYKRRIRANQLA